ncbi:hypothetical protein J421_4175 [Gemmatirosa kalamazoonensis]|uniref:Uncharacterized protein n=1 Tax=Gemmatirosa kalamazoonensis TaxID=861299 RepID=W0RMN0_9BACT|nr:carboxypeptidase-like regulatory domain-containing protein [Gemmatirosa kalamazoonensis]AHG91712.1 hypothetical protein J421_4175 [Gemmatirosa kalamazoonensis]
MPLPSPIRSTLTLTALLAACSNGDKVTTAHAEGESARTAMHPTSDVPLPNITAGTTPYAVSPVTDGGTVSGSVELSGPPPADSSVTPPPELQRECGATLPLRTVQAQGTHLGGAVVWLEGVRRGKALPAVRRFEVAIDGCQLEPRAQAVTAGGTLHVHSESRMHALVRMTRWPEGTTVATVTTNDDGEVVPDDKVLSTPGVLEVRGAQPAWLRAWVLVLDHPYAATTAAAGTFSLDSVPAGQYKLVAWHERFGRVEQPVTVTAGQTTSVTLRFGAPNAAPIVADSARTAGDTAARGRRR